MEAPTGGDGVRQPRFYWFLELIGGPYDGQMVMVDTRDLGVIYESVAGRHVYVRNNWTIGDGCPYMDYRGFDAAKPTEMTS